MRDDGERISRGQVDRGDQEARATREALLMVGLFAGAVLINGLLAIVGIEALQASACGRRLRRHPMRGRPA